MKKRVPRMLIMLCLLLTTIGCGSGKEQEVLKNIKYSNMKEKTVQDTLKDVMEDADELKKFQVLFSTIPTKNTKDVREHAAQPNTSTQH